MGNRREKGRGRKEMGGKRRGGEEEKGKAPPRVGLYPMFEILKNTLHRKAYIISFKPLKGQPANPGETKGGNKNGCV